MPPTVYVSRNVLGSGTTGEYVYKITREGKEPEFFPDVEIISRDVDGVRPVLFRYAAGHLWFLESPTSTTFRLGRFTDDALPVVRTPTWSTTTFGSPFGFDISADGNWAYLACLSVITRVNTSTGAASVVAGDISASFGHVDGVGAAVRFNRATDCMFGPDGLLYIADWVNEAIRTLNVNSAQVSTWHTGISSLSLYWRNGNLYRSNDSDATTWVHYAEELAVAYKHADAGFSAPFVVSVAGNVYISDRFRAVRVLETYGYEDRDGPLGQEKSYASNGSSNVLFAGALGDVSKSYETEFLPGPIAIRGDEEDDDLFPTGVAARGAGEIVESTNRLSPVNVTVIRVSSQVPIDTAEHPTAGTNTVDTIVDTLTDLVDIECDENNLLWVSSDTSGISTIDRSSFEVTNVRPDLVNYQLVVGENGELYALKYRTASSGAIPCSLYRVISTGGGTQFVAIVPAGSAVGANNSAKGFAFDGQYWWAWKYRASTALSTDPLYLVRISSSGSVEEYHPDAIGGIAPPTGSHSGFAQMVGLVYHGGFLYTVEGFDGIVYRIDMSSFLMTKVTSNEVATIEESTFGSEVDGPVGWIAWNRATGLYRRYLSADPVLYLSTEERLYSIDLEGLATRLAGFSRAGYVDGYALGSEFNRMVDVTFDSRGYGYIIESVFSQHVRRYQPGGATSRSASESTDQSVRLRPVGAR